jgi:hypothetical protein
MKNRYYSLFFILILLIPFLSCTPETGEKAENTGVEYEINKDYTSGPCTLVIKIDKKEISIAESITMLMEVTVDKDYHLELPQFGENLQQFKIIDFYDKGQKLIDDKRITEVQEYKLEPYLSGEYIIPRMRVKFWTDAEGSEDPHILESEDLTITVTSILPEDMENLTIKDVTQPVLPPPPDYTWLIIMVMGIILAVGGAVIFITWLQKKKQKEQPVITIPAHEYAYRQLELLIRRKYIEKEEFKLFYIGISTILRHYIENRFLLHAPEQTTEEFLHDLKTSRLLSDALKSILTEFLHHCDRVKFAKHIPSTEEIQKTFDTCKNFIMTTEDENARIEEPAAAEETSAEETSAEETSAEETSAEETSTEESLTEEITTEKSSIEQTLTNKTDTPKTSTTKEDS